MTDEKLSFVVLAGLLHDTGKLFERGEIFSEARKDPVCLESCRKGIQGNSFSHLHSAHTRAFCDWLEERFDCLKKAADRSWKIWCASHHRDDETGAEASVIRIADRLSSGEREPGDYYRTRIHQKTRLEPVLERVFLDGCGSDCLKTSYRYPLARLATDKQSLFAAKGDEVFGLREMDGAEAAIDDPVQWHHLVADAPLTAEYRKLGQGLLDETEALSARCRHMALPDLIVCLTTLLERYTANVPSATNVRHPDISLFDHLRTTAAIAQALYLFQENKGQFPTVLPEKDEVPRWLLVCGDFSGIQKFIYNLTNKGAAKGLRGRSFYVGHFCRICADHILISLGLARAALLYNSGGKFYLLIPAHLREELYKVRAEVNGWLLDRFGGDVFFGLGLAEVTASMFSLGKMHTAWKRAAEDLEQDRMRKFREQMLCQDNFFDPQTKDNPAEHCRICGSSRDLKEIDRDGNRLLQCRSCDEMERLGQCLADTEAIVTLYGAKEEADLLRDEIGGKTRLFSLDNLTAENRVPHYLMIPKDRVERLAGREIPGECMFLNDLADCRFDQLPLPVCGVSAMYLGKWDARRQTRPDETTGDPLPWDFEDYAKNARGIERMGVLRMDVDNLGMVFIKGLKFPEREAIQVNGRTKEGWGHVVKKENGDICRKPMASISRMVTLSRQLNHFFSGYVPSLLEQERFDQCQVIYAGGDDLFVIGSWHQLPELAETIRAEFRAFCCKNPAFSISGGITLQRGKYPIYKGAQLAGEAEKKAKGLRKAWKIATHDLEKDCFCFLNVPVVWEDFKLAKEIRALLEEEMGDGQDVSDDAEKKKQTAKNRGLLAYLARMTAGNKILVQNLSLRRNKTEAEAWQDIAYDSWRWRTAYHLRRRYKKEKNETRKRWIDILFANNNPVKASTIPVYAWLELPIRWTQFFHREKGGK